MTDTSEVSQTVALPGPAEVEAEVVEGVVVDDDAPMVQSVVLRPVQVVKIVVAHEHTKAAGRHLAYVPLGASVMGRRLTRAPRPVTSGSCARPKPAATMRPRWSGTTGCSGSVRTATNAAST